MPLKMIIARQQRWANTQWPGHSGQRAPSMEGNLIIPMTPEVRIAFENAGGNELGRHPEPGKMQSLRSSSALAYNFFAPWCGHDLHPLASAFGMSIRGSTVSFEYKFEHGLGSEPPNLDVALDVHQKRPIGIECKFTEPYGPKAPCVPLKGKYFSGNRKRWAELGLSRCQSLAEGLGNEDVFHRLDAGQLLKHILGLAWSSRELPRLIFLWFDSRCNESAELQGELRLFADSIDPSIEFRAVSYQVAFDVLKRNPEPCAGYFKYLSERYL